MILTIGKRTLPKKEQQITQSVSVTASPELPFHELEDEPLLLHLANEHYRGLDKAFACCRIPAGIDRTVCILFTNEDR
jgi:hypothetical protein